MRVSQSCFIKNLKISFMNERVVLDGTTSSYYNKQLASQAVIRLGLRVDNRLIVPVKARKNL